MAWRAPAIVPRPELFRRLSEGPDRGVTLLSAPAGSGKTVLLRSWIETAELLDQTAWVSVERGDVDPQRFWIAVVDALRAAVRPAELLTELEPAVTFDGEAVVERIARELTGLDHPVVLVIDDLHELESPDALRQLEVLLADRPPLLRIVLATRSDPQLGLHRLRLADELTEIRSGDLSFTLDETRELLADAGVSLSEASLVRIRERTEGWAAGLRLATLALAAHPDPERLLEEFSGSEQSVADYLLNEVLERLPHDALNLLVRTSVLDRVNGELADLLAGSPGSERILFELERDNVFVTAVDAGRLWFRYHRLFVDFLRLELERREPDAAPLLHRRAAAWLEAHGYLIEALRHAQEGEDWPTAIRLLADHGTSLMLDGHGTTIDALLARFPGRVVLSEPELSPLLAARQATTGSAAKAEGYLSLGERSASAVPDARRQRFEILLGLARLLIARRRGDFERAIGEAKPLLASGALNLEVGLGDDVRTAALANLGIVELWSGRVDAAEHHLELALDQARSARRPQLEVATLAHQAVLARRRSLADARALATEALAIADARGWMTDPAIAVALVVLGDLDVWQGHFERADEWLARAKKVWRPELDPAAGLLLNQAEVMLLLARGRDEDAVEILGTSRRLEALLVLPHSIMATSLLLLVQAQVRLDRLEAAEATLSELRDRYSEAAPARIAEAIVHLANEEAPDALDALAALLHGNADARDQLLVQAHLVSALAHERLDEREAAEADFERALELAEPQAAIWPFVVTPVSHLIEGHPRHRSAHGAFSRELLGLAAGSAAPHPGQEGSQSDLLTEGELRVLRYLPTNLSATEIGAELSLSIHTIRTHTRRIYTKLGVQRRTDAVERARAIGLL